MPDLRLAGIVPESSVDGPGLRMVLFAQGCLHHCAGCHNPQTHSLYGGQFYSIEELLNLYQQNPLLAGVSISGGEPFLQAQGWAIFAQKIQALGATVFTYTGWRYEELSAIGRKNKAVQGLLDFSDWLVDGPFIESRKTLALSYRGSSNQRILNRKARKALDLKTEKGIRAHHKN